MKKILFSLVVFAIVLPKYVFAQDDLMKMAMQNPDTVRTKVIATFKTTKLISAQTNETVHKRTLDFRVAHLFGNVGKESHGGVHTFYGLDASADIRIALEYGITDKLTVGISRCKRQENYEGLAKYRLLEQTSDNKIPLAVTLFVNAAYSAVENRDGSIFPKSVDRISYTSELILARKFSSRISIELVPTLVHRNYVFSALEKNDVFALGGGGRFRFTRSTSFVVDYFYSFDKLRKINNDNGFYNPLGVGFEIETGGHVFTIMFSNASGIIENDFIPNTSDSWSKWGFKLNFNISRNFKL
ncbi:MAG: DUF5777 family beta-barrel protein [Bacteroidota bacterium]